MKTDNPKLNFCSDPSAAIKSSLSLLLIGILLFSSVTDLFANGESDKNAWALNSSTLSSQDRLAEASPDSDVKAELAAVVVLEELSESEPLEASQAIGSQETLNNYSEETQDNYSEETLENYDVTQGAAPLDIPLINVKPLVALSPELQDSLKRQFQQIQTLKETEEAFSEQLGESYLAYGRALMRAGQVEDSRNMLVNAVHIAKINNGVTSIEQRPILRELFEMSLALGNTEEMTEQITRIIWLEERNPQSKDVYSFDMVVRLGNHYLDLFLNRPVISELSLSHLNQSAKYLGYAIDRYGDRPLSEILLPYGDLALARFEQSRIQDGVNRAYSHESRRDDSINLKMRQRQQSKLSSYSRSESVLKQYLRKAKLERDLVNTIQALLGLGDLSLLTGRAASANKYFDLAWSGAQNLPVTHPIIESFNGPVKLPSFNLSVVRKPLLQTKPTELVALLINIDDDGVVRRVANDDLVKAEKSATSKAKRQVKRYRFRPMIENGKLVASTAYRYEVEVASRKSKDVASKDVASKDIASKDNSTEQ
jgi:hypothetical protein